MEAKDLTSPKAKGKRLQRLRNIANLSRRELINKSDINQHTLRGWENGLATGLSRAGADKILAATNSEGVICSFEWLMYGVGQGPRIIDTLMAEKNQPEKISRDKEEEHIIKELVLFRELSENAIDYVITDDGMFPFYKIGDYVAGIKCFGKKIAELIGEECIVQTEAGEILFRKIQEGSEKEKYNLVCTNLETKTKKPIIYNIKLQSAAKLIWLRRKL